MFSWDKLSHSIFFRIYAGLIFVCATVALLAYILVTTINNYRASQYREAMATGAFYLVAAGVAKQEDDFAKDNWLYDASSLFDATFSRVPLQTIEFSTDELERLTQYQAVVRFSDKPTYGDIFQKIPNSEEVLTVRLTKVTEQQVKAMGVFLQDDLAYFPGNEKQRLEKLEQYFSYPLNIKKLTDVDLDLDQVARIRRKEIVIMLRDNSRADNSAIHVVIPTMTHDEVIVMGPVQLFNWAPFRLISSITIFSLLLISLGVYALIFPLEKKIRLIQSGVTRVREGKLDAKVKVVGQDEVAHLATTFNSMTEHIKRLIDSQRELTRAVSHELRTPVARVRFAVDMLADTDDASSRLKQLDNIDRDIEALDVLIDEMLTYAKMEESSPKLNMESINLHDLVEQIVNETNALGKDVRVYSAPISTKIVAVADMRYLHRVLQNLAGNATRYANKNIRISAGVDRQYAFVSVEDDGAGIPEKDREKVFMPFARLDDSRTRASGGYGLGLSIVSRIAFWFDGKMKVDESPELGGARFTMRWPVKPLQAKQLQNTLNAKIKK